MSHLGHEHGDGDAWVECAAGHRHWGRFGAAGLLAHRREPDGTRSVLLQHRAEWSHHGGTWGLLGGARTSTETAVTGALREAAEEGGVEPGAVRVDARFDDDHGGWSYVTVLAETTGHLEPRPTGGESIDVAWLAVGALADLPLHPGFAASWPVLGAALAPLALVVDVANVMGARPDGWWRDRAAAAGRIVRDAQLLARSGLPDAGLPAAPSRAAMAHWWPQVHLVLEGAARAAADPPPDEPAAGRGGYLSVHRAAASGDDEVVDVATAAVAAGSPVLVVSADRELRMRVQEVGAAVTGPGWWWRLVDPQRD